MRPEILEKTMEISGQLGTEVKRVKDAVAVAVENGIGEAKRAAKEGRRAAEDLVDDAEYKIKHRPFSAVGVTFGIGLGLGAVIGALMVRGARCGR
jgi:ElaB/YqjD/DUF883 family membrane-anchored ribosome-binding protein